jgi:hypothetical protein
MRRTTCAVVVMALVAACASHRAEENGAAEPELIEGRTYTMDEVYPRAAESDLRFDARATIDPADSAVIHVEVTITNARHARRRIEFGNGCDGVRLRLYASPERTRPPVWDSLGRARADLAGGLPVVCMGTDMIVMFEGNGSDSPGNFRVDMKVHELKQGLLPEGTYHVTAEIRLDQPRITREIAAGSVILRRP